MNFLKNALLLKTLKLTTYVQLWVCLIFFSYISELLYFKQRNTSIYIDILLTCQQISWFVDMLYYRCRHMWAGSLLNALHSWGAAWRQLLDPWFGSTKACPESSKSVSLAMSNASWLQVGLLLDASSLHIPKLLIPGGLISLSIVAHEHEWTYYSGTQNDLGHLHDTTLKQIRHTRKGVQKHLSWLFRKQLRFRITIAIFSITLSIPSCFVILNNRWLTALAKFMQSYIGGICIHFLWMRQSRQP